jgi:hypothetical protein
VGLVVHVEPELHEQLKPSELNVPLKQPGLRSGCFIGTFSQGGFSCSYSSGCFSGTFLKVPLKQPELHEQQNPPWLNVPLKQHELHEQLNPPSLF